MKNEKYNSIVTKIIDLMRVVFFVMASFIVLFFAVGQIVCPDERDGVKESFRTYNNGWVWVKEDGTSVPLTIPGDNDVEPGTYMNIQNVLPEDMEGISVLCIQAMWQDIEVYVDGELRTSYNTDNTRPFGENSAIKYVFVDIDEKDAGKTINIKTWSTTVYSGTIRKIYIGDEMSFWLDSLSNYGFKAFLEIVLMVISITCIIICTAIRIFNKRKVSLIYLAWGIFLCAMWLFSEVHFRQLIFSNVSVLSSVTFFAMMLIHFPFMLYVNDLQKGRYKLAYAVGFIYTTIVTIALTILQVLSIFDFRNTISLMHSSIIIGGIIILVTVIIDIVHKYTKDYKAVSVGFMGITIGAFMETIIFYFDPGMTVGTYISIALIFLLVMAAIKTVQDYLSTEKEKQHALLANEAKAQFLANMSHEIRTPINTIIGMNEMILRESNSEAILEYANNINNSSKLLLGLINDVLDFSKIESGQLKLICDAYNLSELIVDEVLLIETRARSKGLDMLLEVDENLPSKLYGDELRIKQIVMNLLTNAVKYTSEGSITLAVSARPVSDEVIILNIAVKDTGKGIKKENLNSLFETFTRIEEKANRNIEGTGLGLNITQKLVEKMNGEIVVESEYGKGSVFTVKIPQTIMDKEPIGDIHEAHRKMVQQRAIQKESFTAPRAHVLAVDDNDMNLAVIESLLKRTLVKLDLAMSGEECLKMTRKKAYDLIFMDHMMPGMDGIETLKALRKDEGNYNKDIPIIALTANAVAGSQEFYLENGFDDYLSKPVDVVKLEQTLVKYLPDNLVTLT